MNDSSDSESPKDINESQIFEENNLYISGKVFKQSLLKINTEFDELEKLFKKEEFNSFDIKEELSIDDIKINSLEEDVETIIKKTINSVSENKPKNKKIFVLKNEKEKNNEEEINKEKEKDKEQDEDKDKKKREKRKAKRNKRRQRRKVKEE